MDTAYILPGPVLSSSSLAAATARTTIGVLGIDLAGKAHSDMSDIARSSWGQPWHRARLATQVGS
jgi:hypothetical protein